MVAPLEQYIAPLLNNSPMPLPLFLDVRELTCYLVGFVLKILMSIKNIVMVEHSSVNDEHQDQENAAE